MTNWRTNWEQDEKLLIKDSRKSHDVRHCKRCKRKTMVVYEKPVSEKCFECGKDYDIEDINK